VLLAVVLLFRFHPFAPASWPAPSAPTYHSQSLQLYHYHDVLCPSGMPGPCFRWGWTRRGVGQASLHPLGPPIRLLRASQRQPNRIAWHPVEKQHDASNNVSQQSTEPVCPGQHLLAGRHKGKRDASCLHAQQPLSQHSTTCQHCSPTGGFTVLCYPPHLAPCKRAYPRLLHTFSARRARAWPGCSPQSRLTTVSSTAPARRRTCFRICVPCLSACTHRQGCPPRADAWVPRCLWLPPFLYMISRGWPATAAM